MQNELSSPADHVLFVDDDPDVLKAAGLLLGRNGLRMTPARSPAEAWSVLAAEPVDAVLLDLNFTRGSTSGEEGFQCLSQIVAQDPDAAVVVITGHSGVNIAVAAMRAGAADFVMKPWSNERLVTTIRSALALRQRRRDAAASRSRPAEAHPETWGVDAPLLGESAAMRQVRDLIRRAAPTDAPVLIYGEAGTGKSLIARHLHLQSARASGPFESVDLGALPAEEAAPLLFGDGQDAGALARTRGGTLLLDDVGSLAPALQARLLHALEAERGAEQARILATTRRSRDTLRGQGGLRDDLLYRLNTIEIEAPPLRAREADASLLAEHFLRLYAHRYDRPARSLSAEAAEAIAEHPWPGDVRALRQAMERCVIFAEGEVYAASDLSLTDDAPATPGRSDMTLTQSERSLIGRALKRNSFNISHAAKELGLTRAALYRRMAKHGL